MLIAYGLMCLIRSVAYPGFAACVSEKAVLRVQFMKTPHYRSNAYESVISDCPMAHASF